MNNQDLVSGNSCESSRLDIFISYSREDSECAEALVTLLQKKGLRIWWDRLIQSEDYFRKSIPEALNRARCVLVLWSEHSIESEWVQEEANSAQKAKKLLELQLTENHKPGFGYGRDPIFFHKWNRNEDVECFCLLIKKICRFIPEIRDYEKVESGFRQHVDNVDSKEISQLKVPGTTLYSSFVPNAKQKKFVRLQIPTTDAWIPLDIFNALPKKTKIIDTRIYNNQLFVKVGSEVFIIRDPVRPFETQIGLTRSLRPGAKPGEIVGEVNPDWLKGWYMQLGQESFRWIRMAIAEIITTPEALKYIAENDEDEKIKQLACKNPYSSEEKQQNECLFCNSDFVQMRTIRLEGDAFIISNDFPFGPYFHYVVAVRTKPKVHNWDSLDMQDFYAMNKVIHRFLNEDNRRNLNGAGGIEIGLNSTVRHLVLGKQTHSSAGASISHVHKQVWGMTPQSVNLATHLVELCNAYEKQEIDYLGQYLETLRDMRFILWEDDYVALYVPIGQTSLHELQVMVKERRRHFLDLTDNELRSLSEAEFRVVSLYKAWNINSFNEVFLNHQFQAEGVSECNNFRVIVTFITREVDLAVSELSMLYVVDRSPVDTVRAFIRCKPDTGLDWPPFYADPPGCDTICPE